jgi:D-alanyl-D-alanine carboxypeptidase
MKKVIFTLSLLLVALSHVTAQLSSAYTTRLQFVLDSVCIKQHIKGASVAVLVPGVGTWKGVYGESYTGQNITTDMLLGIGSNTKTYTSSTMLKLQEEGKVSLDDTIGTWLHSQPNINGQITIRQLLNHTSGIYNYTENPAFGDSIVNDFNRVWQPEDMLQFVDTALFTPGTSWSYSNTNYLIAGIIIKQILGQPMNTTFHDYIFTPQGLNNTIFFPADAPTATVARPWSVDFSGTSLEDLTAVYGYSNTSMFSAAYTAGAIMQTAEDNVNFWYKLISGNIINSGSLSQMLNFVHIGYWAVGSGHNIGYGLGIFKYQNYMNGHTIYTHGGTNIGYINENMVDSVTGVCISVLTNQDSISNSQLMTGLEKALHKVTITMSPTEVAVFNESKLDVYPNPATNFITVNIANASRPAQFNLYDINGKCVISEKITEDRTVISAQKLLPGIYVAQLYTDNILISTEKIQIIK